MDYFIQKGIVDALGTTQDKSFASPVNFRFLLDILKHNDNSQNSVFRIFNKFLYKS